MHLEAAFNLPVVLVVAMAALYVWYLASVASIFDRVFAYPRDRWGPLWNCSWCLSFWVVGVLLIVTKTYDPITHLAAAGVAGFVGSKA